MKHRTRKWLSLVLLLLWLPAYIAMSLYVVSLFERPSFLLELAIYVLLGIAWALPFRKIFKGVGREDPENPGPGAT
ncbi:MAG: DUF2842 domain-containing protein [Pseudomonadota bacterium]